MGKKGGAEIMAKSERNQEQRLRRRASSRGFAVYKSRQSPHFDNQGLYMLAELRNNSLVLGERYDASLNEIEEYLKDINPLRIRRWGS
jgi:hypothetical protein